MVKLRKRVLIDLIKPKIPAIPGLGQYLDEILIGQVHSMQLARR